MSTSAASLAMSSAAMSAAQSAERAARRAECAPIIGSFDARGADLVAMRAYATCVRDVHGLGEPLTPFEAYALKGAICIVLLCVLVGAIWGWLSDPYDRILNTFGGMLAGLTAGLVSVAVIAAVYYVVAA